MPEPTHVRAATGMVSSGREGQARLVPCPSCGRPAPFAEGNPWRPFCGERCRSVDLGAWASERFRVPVQVPTEVDDAPGAPPGDSA